MTEFQELVKDAPKFASMERGELAVYAYAMYAAGVKVDAENAKLKADAERMFQANVEKNNEVLGLLAENAKLRELVALMSGPYGYGTDKRVIELKRELGIEGS